MTKNHVHKLLAIFILLINAELMTLAQANAQETMIRSFIMGGGHRYQYMLHPLLVANTSSTSVSFDRIIITFKRDAIDSGEVTAQAIYFHPNGTKSTIQSFGGNPVRSPTEKLDTITIEPGEHFQLPFVELLCYATVPGRAPTVITIRLLNGNKQVSSTHSTKLPLLNTLPSFSKLYRMGRPKDPDELGVFFEIPSVSR